MDGVFDTSGPSKPLMANYQVLQVSGAWLQNYVTYPWMLSAPIIAYVGLIMTAIHLKINKAGLAFITSSLAVFGLVATVGVSLFPFLLPSSSHATQSLLVWNASSSPLTLVVMLIATAIFIPLILIYTTWVYRVLRGKITVETINENADNAY